MNNNLFDIKMCNRKCTNHVEPAFAKLDRFMVIVDWLDHYPLTCVTALSREWSGHNPLLLDTGIGCVKLFHFKLELCWLTREDVMDVVRPVWEIDAGNRTLIEEWVWRLAKTRKKLRGWSRNVDNIFRKENKAF
jgi:hypothetical protein